MDFYVAFGLEGAPGGAPEPMPRSSVDLMRTASASNVDMMVASGVMSSEERDATTTTTTTHPFKAQS